MSIGTVNGFDSGDTDEAGEPFGRETGTSSTARP
jgi:hypothetical protein